MTDVSDLAKTSLRNSASTWRPLRLNRRCTKSKLDLLIVLLQFKRKGRKEDAKFRKGEIASNQIYFVT
jgi:hypothetical protein